MSGREHRRDEGSSPAASSGPAGLPIWAAGLSSRRATTTPGRPADLLVLAGSSGSEAVIGGWLSGQGSRGEHIGSLMLGIPDPAEQLAAGRVLRYIGDVGTGFTAATLVDLATRLTPLTQPTSPFTARDPVPSPIARTAHWVRPELVGEVGYAALTSDGTLRHPSLARRLHKHPGDVHLE